MCNPVHISLYDYANISFSSPRAPLRDPPQMASSRVVVYRPSRIRINRRHRESLSCRCPHKILLTSHAFQRVILSRLPSGYFSHDRYHSVLFSFNVARPKANFNGIEFLSVLLLHFYTLYAKSIRTLLAFQAVKLHFFFNHLPEANSNKSIVKTMLGILTSSTRK